MSEAKRRVTPRWGMPALRAEGRAPRWPFSVLLAPAECWRSGPVYQRRTPSGHPEDAQGAPSVSAGGLPHTKLAWWWLLRPRRVARAR